MNLVGLHKILITSSITRPNDVSDGVVDIRDIALAAINFGNNQPEWISITTYLDTDSNVIFGDTNRLSIFGVHHL